MKDGADLSDVNKDSQLSRKKGSLMEFLVSSDLNILNHGNEPTFVVCNRK
jgi:hypothetical protein